MNLNPDFQAKRLDQLKKLNADPNFQAKRLNHLKNLNSDPDFQAKRLNHLKKLHADPDFQAKRLDHLKKLHADPDFQAKMSNHREKLADSIIRVEVSATDTQTGLTTNYASISEAARGLDAAASSLFRYFSRETNKLFKGRYVLRKVTS